MATFQYQGTNAAGRRVKGLVAAETIRSARDQLRESGVMIRKIREREEQHRQPLFAGLRRKRATTALTDFVRELSTLLQAGIPLLEAMDSCIPQAKPSLREPLAALRDRVAGGDSLAAAMEQEAWLFDEMMVGMVRVGEAAGNLEEVLDQVAGFREQSADLQNRVLSAVLYPAIVFSVSVLVTLFLMTVVVPMLLQNLEELGSRLPWPTRVLKHMSDTLLLHGWWIILVFSGVSGMLAYWLRTEQGRVASMAFAIRIPVLGTLLRKQAIGRMSLVVACLLRSGVELTSALQIAAQTSSNLLLRRALKTVTLDVERGQGLREAFLKHSVFPPSVAQIYAVGQQSGQLDTMLQRLGSDYDKQAATLANRVASLSEPLLILMLSVVVGFILFATILPILEAGSVLSG